MWEAAIVQLFGRGLDTSSGTEPGDPDAHGVPDAGQPPDGNPGAIPVIERGDDGVFERPVEGTRVVTGRPGELRNAVDCGLHGAHRRRAAGGRSAQPEIATLHEQ